MEKELIFSAVSSVLLFVGNIPYLIDTIKGKTYPHPVSFTVWGILTGFNAYVLFHAHEYYSLIPAILATIFCAIFVPLGIVHFKKIQIHFFDKICLLFICLVGIYWISFHNILHTVVLTIIVDFLAFLLVFKKGWLQPWSETLIAYLIPGIVNLFILSANLHQSIETIIFWFYMFLINTSFVVMMIMRRLYIKGGNSLFQ